jgi:hypothetical protein
MTGRGDQPGDELHGATVAPVADRRGPLADPGPNRGRPSRMPRHRGVRVVGVDPPARHLVMRVERARFEGAVPLPQLTARW